MSEQEKEKRSISGHINMFIKAILAMISVAATLALKGLINWLASVTTSILSEEVMVLIIILVVIGLLVAFLRKFESTKNPNTGAVVWHALILGALATLIGLTPFLFLNVVIFFILIVAVSFVFGIFIGVILCLLGATLRTISEIHRIITRQRYRQIFRSRDVWLDCDVVEAGCILGLIVFPFTTVFAIGIAIFNIVNDLEGFIDATGFSNENILIAVVLGILGTLFGAWIGANYKN